MLTYASNPYVTSTPRLGEFPSVEGILRNSGCSGHRQIGDSRMGSLGDRGHLGDLRFDQRDHLAKTHLVRLLEESDLHQLHLGSVAVTRLGRSQRSLKAGQTSLPLHALDRGSHGSISLGNQGEAHLLGHCRQFRRNGRHRNGRRRGCSLGRSRSLGLEVLADRNALFGSTVASLGAPNPRLAVGDLVVRTFLNFLGRCHEARVLRDVHRTTLAVAANNGRKSSGDCGNPRRGGRSHRSGSHGGGGGRSSLTQEGEDLLDDIGADVHLPLPFVKKETKQPYIYADAW